MHEEHGGNLVIGGVLHLRDDSSSRYVVDPVDGTKPTADGAPSDAVGRNVAVELAL
jgi:hypothetical protein